MKKIYLNIILAFAFIALIYIFLFIPAWFHEQGHIGAAKEQGINFYFRFNGLSIDTLLMKIPLGEAVPLSANDCEKFNSLSKDDREKITHAGLMPGIIAFTVLWIIPIFIFAYFRRKAPKSVGITYLLIYMLLYFIYIVWTLWLNVYSTSLLNDWHFSNIANCARYG